MNHPLRLLAAATLASAAGFAPLTSQAADGVLAACIGKATGTMRLADPAGTCRSGETPVSWNVQGPQGPQGPAGPQTFMSAVVLASGTIQVLNKPAGSTFTVTRTAPGNYLVAVSGLGNTCPLPSVSSFSPVLVYLGGGGCGQGTLSIPVVSSNNADTTFTITVTGLQEASSTGLRSQALTRLGGE